MGDDVQVTIREDSSREIKFPGREETVGPSQPQRVKTLAVALEHCLETDATGRRARYTVTLTQWSVDNGLAKDDSLQGAVLEVKGAGKERTFSLTSSPQEPSKPARAWLDRHYGAGHREAAEVRQAWLPKLPVSVGDTWSADLASYLGSSTTDKVDLAKATSTCTLASVDSGVAKVTCVAKVPFLGMPGGKTGPMVPWTKGGTQEIKGTLTISLVGRLVTSTATWSSTLSGEASSDDKTVSFLLKTDRSLDTHYAESAKPDSAGSQKPPTSGAPPAVAPTPTAPTPPPAPAPRPR